MSKLLSFSGYQQPPRTLFEIHTLQWLKYHGADNYEQARNNNNFEIIWITKGTGTYWLDTKSADLKTNQLFFLVPGQVHKIQASEDLQGYVISFTESFLDPGDQEMDPSYRHSLYQMLLNCSGVVLNEDLLPDMLDIAERMLKETNNQHLFGTEVLRRYLKIFMIYLSRQFEDSFSAISQTRNIELSQKFLSLLEKKYKTQKMVAAYAQELSVTPNYLNEIVKKTTGQPAGHHIRKRVVLEAKRMALYSDSCMKEIAYNLGFTDSAHFSKFFKTVTGANFSTFKKEKMVFAMAV